MVISLNSVFIRNRYHEIITMVYPKVADQLYEGVHHYSQLSPNSLMETETAVLVQQAHYIHYVQRK